MNLPLIFTVGFSLKDSKQKRSVSLDPVAMEVLGVKEGDTVYATKGEMLGIFLSTEVKLKVTKALPQDRGKKIVRLTGDVEEFQVGDTIMIYTK